MTNDSEIANAEKAAKNNELRKAFGKKLSNPAPGEEVVISGISGKYPNSNNVQEFKDHLFNKEDMVTDPSNRWDLKHPEIPTRLGSIPTIDRFDAGYFGIHFRQVKTLDAMCRMLMEVTIEALFDAGINPSDWEGSRTGVFVGACFSENEKTWFFDNHTPKSYAFTGTARSMLANRISYFLKLKGPSFVCDTACSSSLYALDHAVKAIRMGQCDQAIVGGTNLCLHPFVSLQFARLGVLSLDGACRVFDDTASGYARSEAVSAIILQKSKNACRQYMTILHTKVNCDGYKDSGITFPSRQMQEQLFREFYEECDYVKPENLSFMEAHGTGTRVGDPEELQAIEAIFVPNRKTPLLIGSVKSNIGHTEPASGLCSITKVILAGETGLIPPNIHYNVARSGIKSLANGQMEVVTEPIPFRDDRGLIGVNSFGFGGGNCHVLLKTLSKLKINNGKAQDNIPRLVCVSGRTTEAIDVLLDDTAKYNDIEHIALLHHIHRKNVKSHRFRGYALISKSGEIISKSMKSFGYFPPPLVVVFGIIDETQRAKIKELNELQGVTKTIQRIHAILSPKGININEILLKPKSTNLLEKVLANGVSQLIFADLIKTLNILPDKILSIDENLSLGTLISAYFDDALNLKEAVECIFSVAKAANRVSVEREKDLLVKVPDLTKTFEQILKTSRKLSDKFISRAVFEEITPSNLISSINKKNLVQILDKVTLQNDTVFLEIGNGEIQTYLNENNLYSEHTWLKLPGGLNELLINIGSIFEQGLNPQIQNLYPRVEFPVSRGTPMIASSIKWAHERKWWVPFYKYTEQKDIEQKRFTVSMKDSNYSFVKGHIIDGRNLYPATGYLHLVWETLIFMNSYIRPEMKIVFENCRFIRACAMATNDDTKVEFCVTIQRGSGNFEVAEGDTPVVTGRVYVQMPDEADEVDALPLPVGVSKDVAPYLSKKDIYKELKLRGYNYSGKFRAMQYCDSSIQVGGIVWDDNWITFMDNMLQITILQQDTRLLYVPTGIERLTIEVEKHMNCINSLGDDKVVPLYASKYAGLVRAGGIEIRNPNATSIARRKYQATPVLEKYLFVPNITKLSTEEAVRVDLELLMENDLASQIKVVELVDDATVNEEDILGEIVFDVLADHPLIRPDITVLCKKSLEVKNIKVEDKKLLTEVDCNLVIGTKLFERLNVLKLALSSIKSNGYILSRESLDFDQSSISSNTNVTVLTVFTTDKEKLILCNKTHPVGEATVVEILSSDTEFTWLSTLQHLLNKNASVILLTQDDPTCGVVGFLLALRREDSNRQIQLVFTADSAPKFDPKLPFYHDQLQKHLCSNVYKDGQWGTYRHLLLKNISEIRKPHCILNALVRGDLSSLRWISGPLTVSTPLDPDQHLIAIYYSSMNFRDVMTASGRINVDVVTRDRIEQECVQGFEFSGITKSGKRVMGVVTSGACATLVTAYTAQLFEVPEHWTLEEAATVLAVYMTTIYGLLIRAEMKRGESILIHSGTGGIGQAAIILALHYGCTVYTTVGTAEKREFIKKKFPQISDDHIGNSRDTSFEQMILRQTNGKGVDLVLNSLAEEKLLASVRCLGYGGRFVEIGKFDLGNDNPLNLMLLEKEASFHGVMLDALQKEPAHKSYELHNKVRELIEQGVIKPLNRVVFPMDQVEEAFRYMGTGKHTGKVLIQIRKEEEESMNIQQFSKLYPSLPRYYCNRDNVYVIIGGLGGFGLELADWLILRGCRKLVLSSRSGIKTGYAAYRIAFWKGYGCDVHIFKDDITTYEGCESLIQKSAKLGTISGIFNLAVVLQDALFQNQTADMYKISFKPKAYATEYLDIITRKYCPELQDFVVFSSVSCGRGNAGQTNYAMANSVMERICEKRRREGLPALTVEWGAVGDVGLVADLQEDSVELEIGGTLQQRLSNCLQVLDGFLNQTESAVVSSMVVAEKRSGSGSADNIVNAVANILGVKDLQTISLQATLAEVGMDSMTAVEIKQTLEREYEVFLTAQDIKSMTFAKLLEIQNEKTKESELDTKKERALIGMEMVLRFSIEETQISIPYVEIKTEKSANESLSKTIFLFPGIEGTFSVMEPLYNSLVDAEIIGFQYCPGKDKETIEENAKEYLKIVEEKLAGKKSFYFICYSFGGAIGLQVAHSLEEKGYEGKIILIDSSPDFLKNLTKMLEVESDDKFQISILVHLMSIFISYNRISEYLEPLMKLTTLEARITLAQSAVIKEVKNYSAEYQRLYTISVYKRLRALLSWNPEFKFKSKIGLCKAKLSSVQMESDYLMTKFCEQPLEIEEFEGNHLSILDNENLLNFINRVFDGAQNTNGFLTNGDAKKE